MAKTDSKRLREAAKARRRETGGRRRRGDDAAVRLRGRSVGDLSPREFALWKAGRL